MTASSRKGLQLNGNPWRSAAELLRRPFNDLSEEDLRQIVDDASESLVLELKEELDRDALAKACAAFANTIGGLLLVGISDDGSLVGISRRGAEAPVWVKDILRPRVTPLPPFRARWVALDRDAERAVLAILVEESATTPHLLTRSGSIFVRTQGASDPLTDQRVLFDLIRRGERAAAAAETTALDLAHGATDAASIERLAVVPTGVAADFRERLFSPADEEAVCRALAHAFRLDDGAGIRTTASQHELAAQSAFAQYIGQVFTYSARCRNDGGVVLAREDPAEEGYPPHLYLDHLVQRLGPWLEAATELLLGLGGHGALRVALSIASAVSGERYFFYAAGAAGRLPPGASHTVATWSSLAADDVDVTIERLLSDLASAAGVRPSEWAAARARDSSK
jgi:hypothetical protein